MNLGLAKDLVEVLVFVLTIVSLIIVSFNNFLVNFQNSREDFSSIIFYSFSLSVFSKLLP